MLQVNPVNNRHNLRQFIRLPWSIYADDPAWVPPLLLERKEHLSPHNPYFEHAQYQSWIAFRDGKTVGRITRLTNFTWTSIKQMKVSSA
jgi:hypothetical protein